MPFTALPILDVQNTLVDAIARYSLENHRISGAQAGARTLCYAKLSHRFFRLMLAVHSGRNLEVGVCRVWLVRPAPSRSISTNVVRT